MDHKFSNFMNQIPDNFLKDDEKYLCSDVALFKPKAYVANKVIQADDFHIFLLSSLPPDIYINGKLQQLERGKIFVVNPGDSTFCENAPKTKPFLSMLIKPELVERIAGEMGFTDNVKFLKFQNPFSSELMQAINSFDKETRRPDNFALMLDCLGVQIVTLLLREFKSNLKKYLTILPDGDSYVSLAMEFMQVFFSANITLEDICEEVHVSPFHFIRTFKQKAGISPHQYLLNVRIKKAEELLRANHYTVAEVATLCGFVSPAHFSNTFKVITGHSPRDYKKTLL